MVTEILISQKNGQILCEIDVKKVKIPNVRYIYYSIDKF